MGSDVDGPRVSAGVGSTEVGASVRVPNVGPKPEIDVGSIEGVAGGCAGAVVALNEGPNVIAVVGLIVDDEGERVKY